MFYGLSFSVAAYLIMMLFGGGYPDLEYLDSGIVMSNWF